MSLRKKRKSQTRSRKMVEKDEGKNSMDEWTMWRTAIYICQMIHSIYHSSIRKNGVHKLSINPPNGKLMLEEPPCPDHRHEQDLIKFCSEGEALIQIQEKDPKNLEAISKIVQQYKNVLLPWEDSNYCLRLCDLDGTDYMGQDYMQEAWEDLYLPKKTKMQVLGTLEYTQDILHSVPCVILVGEDGCIYAYREEELQLIAKSLKEFVDHGKREAYKTYSYPKSREKEDQSPPQDEEILKIRQNGRGFVNKSAKKFGAFLDSLPPKSGINQSNQRK